MCIFSFQAIKNNIQRLRRNLTGSCFVFVVMAHGACGYIFDRERKKVDISRDIISQFDAQSCPGLQGKPKLFIIQACRITSK